MQQWCNLAPLPHWGHNFCAECLDCAQSKETPGAFHVTEGPLFSIFNSDISSESVISQSSQRSKEERSGKKDSSGGKVKNRQSCWPASKSFCKMNCKVIFISLCNALQYEQTLFCNTIAMLSHRNALHKVFKRWNWLNLSPNKWV